MISNSIRLNFIFVFLGIAIIILLQGCTSLQHSSSKTIQIKGLIIKNQEGKPVENFILKANANGRFVTCGYIAIDGECSTTFPLKEYQGNTLSISWKQYNQQYSYNDITTSQDSLENIKSPVYVVISLRPNVRPLVEIVHLPNKDL